MSVASESLNSTKIGALVPSTMLFFFTFVISTAYFPSLTLPYLTVHMKLLLLWLYSVNCLGFGGGGPWNGRYRSSISSVSNASHESISKSHDTPTFTTLHSSNTSEGSRPGEDKITADILSLDSIRSSLIRQEETIIFALIERAQYSANAIIYKSNGLLHTGVHDLPAGAFPGGKRSEGLSFLDYMLMGTEVLHSSVRRYTSPEEHAFFPDYLPRPLSDLKTLTYPPNLLSPTLGADGVCVNPALLRSYVDSVVPSICHPGDDEQHGSSVLADVHALQALSKRVHYGKFVAESKYRSDPQAYERLCERGDADGVMALLTNEDVERKVLQRAKMKCATYGREPLVDQIGRPGGDLRELVAAAAAAAAVAAIEMVEEKAEEVKIKPSVIEGIYRDLIIPLTQEVEVEYLFRRCGYNPPKRKSIL